MNLAERVLLVESDGRVLRERADQLLSDGYEVDVVSDGRTACERLAGSGRGAAVLCSLKAPRAMLLLRALRGGEIDGADPRLPVVLVGADEEAEIMRCLEAGADRTVPSKASTLRVAAELRALVRCCRREAYSEQMQVGNMTIDRQTRTVWVGERVVRLTRTEFALLEALAMQVGCALDHDKLSERVWGHPVSRICMQRHVGSLRRTLAEASASVAVETVYGIGPRLRDHAEHKETIKKSRRNLDDSCKRDGDRLSSSA